MKRRTSKKERRRVGRAIRKLERLRERMRTLTPFYDSFDVYIRDKSWRMT